MSRTKDVPAWVLRSPEPVELLLRRIVRRGMAGTLLGSAASLSVACSTPGSADTQNTTPASSVEPNAGRTRDAQVVLDAQADASLPSASDSGQVDAAPADADGSPGDAGTTEQLACSADGQLPIAASGLHTAQPFDYVAVRRVIGVPDDSADAAVDTWSAQTSFTVVSEQGAPCGTATSAACASKLATHPSELVYGTCSQLCQEVSVVTTRGDQVERWAGPSQLTDLLAPIDSADEAVLLVLANGYSVPCGEPSSLRAVADGYEVLATRMVSSCAPVVVNGYSLHVSRSGVLSVLGEMEFSRSEGVCIGRVPAGLKSVSVDRHRSAFGDYLAHVAHLEAASVVAFDRLADELTRHGAPAALVDAARASALDEVRHARVIGVLARAHGGEPSDVQTEASTLRTLEQLAVENATEGCVRETYGALVGAYQAEHASDGALAQVMRVIADDEAQHAALSHRVHAWAMRRLDAAARQRVHVAQAQAIETLLRECAGEPDALLQACAGLPSAPLATAFVRELSRELWNTPVSFAA